MRRPTVLLFLALIPFVARTDQSLLQQIRQSGNAGKIHPQLLLKLGLLPPSEKLAVWIQLRDRPRYDTEDLPRMNFLPPVHQTYIDEAKNLPGAQLLGVSELTNEVSVLIPASSIVSAVSVPFFDRIEESPPLVREGSRKLASHPAYGAYQAVSYNATQTRPLQEATWGGYYWDTTGANRHQKIAVFDEGVWPFHPAFWTTEKLLPTSFGDTASHFLPLSIAAWTSWVHLLPKRSDDLSQLYYMRSSDYGITWDTARVIADAGYPSIIEDFEIGVASDGATQYVVALYLRLWYDANGPRHTVTVVRSANGGTTWSAPLELYTSPSFSGSASYYLDHIGLAVTADGGTVWAYAAWDERSFVGSPFTSTGEVKLRRSNDLGTNTWMTEQTLFSEVKPPTGGIAPFSYAFDELDASADGANANIVFHRVFNDGISSAEEKLLLYSSADDGGTWTNPYNILFSSAPPILPANPSVATKDGTAHIVFGRDSTLRYTRFPSPPGSPVVLTTTVAASPIPDIAVTRDTSTAGTFRRIIHVAWSDARGGALSIRYKRHPNGGDPATAWDDGDLYTGNDNEDISKKISFDFGTRLWKPPVALAATDESANKIALIHIAWRDTRAVNDKVYPWYANSSKVIAWNDYAGGAAKPTVYADHGSEVSSVALGGVVDRTSAGADFNPFMGTAYNGVLAIVHDATEAQSIQGIKWVVDTLGAPVINFSGGYGPTDSGATRLSQYVDWAVARGVVFSKSAGNNGAGAGTITRPGDNFNAMTVGGTLRSGTTIMPISSRGPVASGRIKPDFVAPGGDGDGSFPGDNAPVAGPGGDIYLADPLPNPPSPPNQGMYDWWEGTSFAAPHVAGLSAMLLQAHPTWTPGAIRKALSATASPIALPVPNNNEGWGLVQGDAANGFNPAPFPPSILPTAVDLQDSATGSPITLRILVKPNGGVDSVIANLAAFAVAGTLTLTDSGTIAGGWHIYKATYTIPPGTASGMRRIRVTAYRNGASAYDTVQAYINLYTPGVPLPIQLGSFTGRWLSARQVQLNWMTLSEVNNYGFEVQNSRELHSGFQTIPNSFVPGHGTTLQRQYYSFLDTTASAGTPYYRLKQIDLDGSVHYTEAIRVLPTTVPAGDLPRMFELHQNSPNPFNPATVIRFDVPTLSHVTLAVYDLLGRQMTTLLDEIKPPGYYSLTFDGNTFASGVYYYRLTAGSFTKTRAMVLVK